MLSAGPHAARAHWQPRPTTKPWQWQLQGKIDTSIDVPVFDVDGFETPRRPYVALHRLRQQGHLLPRCRQLGELPARRRRFPRSAIGRRYEGFPDERWLDIRHFRDLRRAA